MLSELSRGPVREYAGYSLPRVHDKAAQSRDGPSTSHITGDACALTSVHLGICDGTRKGDLYGDVDGARSSVSIDYAIKGDRSNIKTWL